MPTSPKPPSRIILHVDCDKFFLAVHTLHEPKLKEMGPLVLWQYNDVICVSPEAAAVGVRKHMRPTEAQALVEKIGGKMVHAFTRKWPGARVWYGPYAKSSREFLKWMRAFLEKELSAPFILERASIDEVFVDVSAAVSGSMEAATALGKRLSHAARESVGIAVTVGIARNRAMAKLASLSAKPPGPGLKAVEDDEQELLRRTAAEKLPGLGGKKAQLEALHVRTAAELQAYDAEQLQTALELASRDAALKLVELSQGRDSTAVTAAEPKQSVSVSSWLTDCVLGDLASKVHLGRGGQAFVIGSGWLFEPHEGATSVTNHTRARWILLSLAIDLEERLLEEHLEFGCVPSKLTITVMGPGRAVEPGMPGFTNGRAKCRSGSFPQQAFQAVSAADSNFAVGSSSGSGARREVRLHPVYGTGFLTATGLQGPAQDGPQLLEDAGRRRRVAAIVDAAASMISAWAREEAPMPVAHLALTARAMSAASPQKRPGQISLAQAFARKRPRSPLQPPIEIEDAETSWKQPPNLQAPIEIDDAADCPAQPAPEAAGPCASLLQVPSFVVSDSEDADSL